MKDFVVARANLPLGARLWTFGTSSHAADDGWSLEEGKLRAGPGFADLHWTGADASLRSPPDQVLRAAIARDALHRAARAGHARGGARIRADRRRIRLA